MSKGSNEPLQLTKSKDNKQGSIVNNHRVIRNQLFAGNK